MDSVPTEIQSSFFDNPYVNSLHISNELLMKKVFGDLFEPIVWFLYEWDKSKNNYAEFEGKKYKFRNIDEYIDYLKNVEGYFYDFEN